MTEARNYRKDPVTTFMVLVADSSVYVYIVLSDRIYYFSLTQITSVQHPQMPQLELSMRE
jgi:hypothetical protein